jgi:hypothetical protein
MIRHPQSTLTTRLAAGLGVAALVALAAPAQDAAKLPGLILHYGFDQADPGGTVPDRSGKDHPGKLSGPKWTAAGKQGGGCELAAPDDRLEIAGSESLALQQATFALWFRTSRVDESWRILLDQGLADGFALAISGAADAQAATRGRLAATLDGTAVCLGETPVADGAWHHAAVTFDGQALCLYLDGQPHKRIQATTAKPAVGPGPVALGKIRPAGDRRVPSRSFEGTIDEVMAFDRALSADEVRTLVAAVDPAAGKPKFTKQQVAGRLRQLRMLRDEGLITQDFYQRKVAECEAVAR